MSQRSKFLADQAKASKELSAIHAVAGKQRKAVLDEGLAQLRSSLLKRLETDCEEFNQEPEAVTELACSTSEVKWKVTRKDSGRFLTFAFDSFPHTVIIKGAGSFKFRSVTEVRPTNDVWYYADKKEGSLGVDSDQVAQTVVGNALAALLEG